jgi:hypothetical protein
MKGHELLAHINIIRGEQGLDPISRISTTAPVCGCAWCVLGRAAACGLDAGSTTEWRRRVVLVFSDEAMTEKVAAALGQPFSAANREVLAPDSIRSFDIAAHFGLTFTDRDGNLRGWIEPTNDDPSTWDLLLLPGYEYPPGHQPTDMAGSR